MNKNTVVGFILIGAILFGFTWYQSKQYSKQQKLQAQQDSIARVEAAKQFAADSAAGLVAVADTDSVAVSGDSLGDASVPSGKTSLYKDPQLDSAMNKTEEYYLLSNDVFSVAFTTKGAQPYSAQIKKYKNYDSTDLYVFKPGMSEFSITLYAGEIIKTKDFVFNLTEKTDTSLVMRLPFSGGGYIQQRYVIHEGSYAVDSELSFENMGNIIPRNVSTFDMDWSVVIPRMEKGYKNEVQYSKLDYMFPGEDRKSVV